MAKRRAQRPVERGRVPRVAQELAPAADNPAQPPGIVRDDRQPARHRLHEDVAKRFDQRHVQERVGGAIERGHLRGGKRDPVEAPGHQFVTKRLAHRAQRSVARHDEVRPLDRGHRADAVHHALGLDKGADHQHDRAVDRQAQPLALRRAGREAGEIGAVGDQRAIPPLAVALQVIGVGADQQIAGEGPVFRLARHRRPVSVLGHEDLKRLLPGRPAKRQMGEREPAGDDRVVIVRPVGAQQVGGERRILPRGFAAHRGEKGKPFEHLAPNRAHVAEAVGLARPFPPAAGDGHRMAGFGECLRDAEQRDFGAAIVPVEAGKRKKDSHLTGPPRCHWCSLSPPSGRVSIAMGD